MKKDPVLKTSIDVQRMKKACRAVAKTFVSLGDFIRPGILTEDVEDFCRRTLLKQGADSALVGFGGFPCAVCTSINNVAAHGIPGNVKLQEGDILTVDLIAVVDGWHGDAAWTYPVGKIGPDAKRVIQAARKATERGIEAAKAGRRITDIGKAIEDTAKEYGCSVLKQLVGHGIGREIHEEPKICNVAGSMDRDTIVPGMVFTVEPILTLGAEYFTTHSDGWSLITSDGSLSAQFEHTIAIRRNDTIILTEAGD